MKKLCLAISMALILLTACTPKEADPSTGSKGDSSSPKVFVLGSEQFASSLDPALEYWGWYTTRYGIGETLFRLNDNLEIEPWLAQSYKNISPDTWEIVLKDNLRFSDGSPLTAEIVVENLTRAGESNPRANQLKEAEYSINGNTISIKTPQPKSSLIHDLVDPYSCIVKIDSIKDKEAQQIIGTGPYKVESFVPDKEISLLPNTNYWNGQAKMDKVMVKKILDKETGALALKNGEINGFVELNPQSFSEFEKDPTFETSSIPTSRAFILYYNLRTMQDENLRKAINMAFDKESIAKDLLKGMVTPSKAFFPQSTPYGSDHLKQDAYNLEEAKKLLDQSGYKDLDGDGYLEKDGKPLNLAIHYYKRLSLEELAIETQATLEKLGIHSNISVHDSPEYLEEGDYDLGFYSVITSPTGDPEAYLTRICEEDGVENFNGFKDPEVNSLLQDLSKTFDSDKRNQLAIEIQDKILGHGAHFVFGFNNLNTVVEKRFKGFKAHTCDYYQITSDLDREN